MRNVMISIRPKWCELIASREKTIEVRKTKPKRNAPFKCYIYECKEKRLKGVYKVPYQHSFGYGYSFAKESTGSGKVIGEFICDYINNYTAEFVDDDCYESIYQVFGEDDTSYVTANDEENPNDCFLCEQSCIAYKDIKKYVGVCFHDKPFYGWHISGLKIYDKPKEFIEFGLKRPPQSWCYVEVEE